MKRIYILFLISLLFFASCKKDDAAPYDSNVKSSLSVEFDNIVGTSDLQLNTGQYTNADGESFSVTKLRYYVSNFVLTGSNGSVYTVPKDSCYFLIDESDESTHEPVLMLPEGVYNSISFDLGVDSLQSTLPLASQTGVLDPAKTDGDMYWNDNAGYIFFKIEGSSPASSNGKYAFGIGGFGGLTIPTFNNIKRITLDLTARGVPKVKAGLEPNIHLMVDILKLFNGLTNVSIAATPVVMFTDYSTVVANNLPDMFRHDHTEN